MTGIILLFFFRDSQVGMLPFLLGDHKKEEQEE